MKKLFTIGSLSLLMVSCEKMERPITTNATGISGKITDLVSGRPIPGCTVLLYPERYGAWGLFNIKQWNRDTYPSARRVTDSAGNYSFEVNATKDIRDVVIAEPADPLHVSSVWTSSQNYTATEGIHVLNLKCRRSAFVRAELVRLVPGDTTATVALYSYSNVYLSKVYRDTTVYLQLVGGTDFSNEVRFSATYRPEQKFSLTASPWDTIPLRITY